MTPLHKYISIAALCVLCLKTEAQESKTRYYIVQRLPEWFVDANIMTGLTINDAYEYDNRIDPLYLEADFNGDNIFDIAIPIKHTASGKVGFAIIHGGTNEIFIIGAGVKISNAQSDNLRYVDIWKVNRKPVNRPGIDEQTGNGPKGELLLKHPSLQIEKSEVGGGQIYWDGAQYAYFHQSC